MPHDSHGPMTHSGAHQANHHRLGRVGLVAIVLLSVIGGLMLQRCWLDGCSPRQFTVGGVGDAWKVAALFAVASLISHTIVVPNGTIVLLIGGYLIGGITAGGIFYLTQVVMAPLVFMAGRACYGGYSDDKLQEWAARLFPRAGQITLAEMRQQGVLVSAMLRLAPFIPSAMSCLLAAGLGIALKRFMLATVAVSWMRPLACAAMGEAMRTATDASTSGPSLGLADMAPLVMLFLAVTGLVAAKLVITAHMSRSKNTH